MITGVIFKRVGDGRPYPDHGLSSRDWSALPPRQIRLDTLVTTKDTLQLAALLDDAYAAERACKISETAAATKPVAAGSPAAYDGSCATPAPGASREDADTEQLIGSGRSQSRGKAPVPGLGRGGVGRHTKALVGLPRADLADLIQQLTDQMHGAAAELQFELAARLRDEIGDLKKELRGMQAAGVG